MDFEKLIPGSSSIETERTLLALWSVLVLDWSISRCPFSSITQNLGRLSGQILLPLPLRFVCVCFYLFLPLLAYCDKTDLSWNSTSINYLYFGSTLFPISSFFFCIWSLFLYMLKTISELHVYYGTIQCNLTDRLFTLTTKTFQLLGIMISTIKLSNQIFVVW